MGARILSLLEDAEMRARLLVCRAATTIEKMCPAAAPEEIEAAIENAMRAHARALVLRRIADRD